MRRSSSGWLLAALLLSACGVRDRPASGPRTVAPGDAGLDGATHDGHDGATGDGSLGPSDGNLGDAGSADAEPFDQGSADLGTADAGHFVDGGFAPDAEPPPPPPGEVQLQTVGCSADFGGELVVSYNGSIAVGSLRGSTLTSSLQFDLMGQSGAIGISTANRISTGLVINLVINSTWTNLAQDPNVITGQAPDPIQGTLVVNSYQPASGVMDLALVGVQLQNPSDGSFCRLDGTIQTHRLGR